VINGEVKKAYVFGKAADRTGSWVTEGDEIMGWKVHSINSGGATLQKDGRLALIALRGALAEASARPVDCHRASRTSLGRGRTNSDRAFTWSRENHSARRGRPCVRRE
jgi:hypothetical protein